MKKVFFLLLVFSSISNFVAQEVGIGSTTPDPSSLLELKSDSKGFLMTRLTTVQRDAIASPAEGLLIYNTTDNCLQFFAEGTWSVCLGTEDAVVSLDCVPTPDVNGVYVAGTVLDATNTLTVSVTTTAATAYFITVNTLNGYSFSSAAGVFTTAGTYSVVLTAKGTPGVMQTDSFTISMAGSVLTCSADVEVFFVAPPIYKNCAEILAANPGSASEVYTIDPDGVGVGNPEFDCYCDMTNDGGGWTLVFRHDATGNVYFTNEAEADSSNENLPGLTTAKYSILNKIDVVKSAGAYEFRLFYPTLGGRNHWLQTFDPRSGPSPTNPVAGYVAVNVDYLTRLWGGLEKSSATTFLDGSVNISWWFYAIGARANYGGANNFPGPDSGVPLVELYIR